MSGCGGDSRTDTYFFPVSLKQAPQKMDKGQQTICKTHLVRMCTLSSKRNTINVQPRRQ